MTYAPKERGSEGTDVGIDQKLKDRITPRYRPSRIQNEPHRPSWMNEEFLSHHGIKGQKWGVRRYQNPDGTLTDAGRKRYSDGDGSDHSGEVPDGRMSSSRVHSKLSAASEKRVSSERHLRELQLKKETRRFFKPSEKAIVKAKRQVLKSMAREDRLIKKAKKIDAKEAAENKPVSKDAVTSKTDDAMKKGSEKGLEDIRKFESMADGPEKREAGSRFLKEIDDCLGKPVSIKTLTDSGNYEEIENIRRMEERSAWLMRKIAKESVDFYNGKPRAISAGCRRIMREIKRIDEQESEYERQFRSKSDAGDKALYNLLNDPTYQEFKRKRKKLNYKLSGQVLRDIGFDDTPENRKYIWPHVWGDG